MGASQPKKDFLVLNKAFFSPDAVQMVLLLLLLLVTIIYHKLTMYQMIHLCIHVYEI